MILGEQICHPRAEKHLTSHERVNISPVIFKVARLSLEVYGSMSGSRSGLKNTMTEGFDGMSCANIMTKKCSLVLLSLRFGDFFLV